MELTYTSNEYAKLIKTLTQLFHFGTYKFSFSYETRTQQTRFII